MPLENKNYFVTALNFDDACYYWFCFDLVGPLATFDYLINEGLAKYDSEQALEWLLKGYIEENSIDHKWLNQLLGLERYRAVLNYHWLKTSMKVNSIIGIDENILCRRMQQIYQKLKLPINLV